MILYYIIHQAHQLLTVLSIHAVWKFTGKLMGVLPPVDQGVALVSSRRLKEVVPVEPSGKRTCDGRLICLSLRAMHQHTGRNRSRTSRNSSTSALPCAKPCYRINRSESVYKIRDTSIYQPVIGISQLFQKANDLGRLFNNSNNKCCVALKCGDRSL